jgi:FkbM family methyltransferase
MTNPFHYYTQSVFTLLRGVRNLPALVKLATRQPSDTPIELDLATGEKFLVSTLMDAWILKETILDRQYEKVSVALEHGWTVVDIGAALGDYAVWASKQIGDGRVYAVEPFPASVKMIRENLRLNQITNTVICEEAIGGQDGLSGLQLVTGEAVQHSTAAITGIDGSVAVSVSSLRSFLIEEKIDLVDYLKMDCEGAEFDILLNCPSEVLKKIKRICMEVHDHVTLHSRDELIKFLERNGYETRLTKNPVHEELAYLYAELK